MPINQVVVFQGKAHWNSLIHPDKYGKWSVKLYLDNASKDKLTELQAEGVLTRLSKDDDGYYANFNRHQKKIYGATERIFDPPIVLERDDKTPFRDNVGHGSDLTVTCEVYPYTIPASNGRKGKALRMQTVRVDNLVPYDKKEMATDAEVKQMRGLSETPPQAEF